MRTRTRRLTLAGLVLIALGTGFWADHAQPFVTVGIVLGVAGLTCLLLPGWFDFFKSDRV